MTSELGLVGQVRTDKGHAALLEDLCPGWEWGELLVVKVIQGLLQLQPQLLILSLSPWQEINRDPRGDHQTLGGPSLARSEVLI